MFEGPVRYLLRKYLGEYVEGLSVEALSINVWKGDVVLKGLKLKAEALNSLRLPVTVKAGFVNTITLKVPWKSIGKEPVIVLIDRLSVLAHPAPDGQALKEEDRELLFEVKLQQIEVAGSRNSRGGPVPGGNSWLYNLISTIIGNLKVTISDVHIIYEDSVSNSGHPFASGFTLSKLAAVTVDDGNETFDAGVALEKLQKRQGVAPSDGNKAFSTSQQKASLENGRKSSSSDHESQFSHEEEEEEEENQRALLRRTTIGNGPPESLYDWTRENDLGISNQGSPEQVFSRGHWHLVRCHNGLRIFEELQDVDYLASCSRAMKAVGVVEASCEAIFQLVMSMDTTRYEWDCSFQYGSLVEEVDGHTAILYHRLQQDWFPMFVWPRDLCYVRHWRRNDDGSYDVLFQSREHQNCGPQPGFVRAHIESGGFNISPLKPCNGRIRTQVQHLMQIDLKGWGVGYVPTFQQHCLLHMLNSVAGLREWFSKSDESQVLPRIPVMVNMTQSVSSKKGRKAQESTTQSSIQMDPSRHSTALEEESDEDDEFLIPALDSESDEDDEFLIPESEPEPSTHEDAADVRKSGRNEEDSDQIDMERCQILFPWG